MKLVIAGYGPVGQAVYNALVQRKGLDIYIDDPDKGYNYNSLGDMEPVDAVVVCVSTPPESSGQCDTSNVEAVIRKYSGAKFLIKSAVDPLWLRSVNEESLTCSPEFLGGSNIHRDTNEEFINQTFAIYGGDDCRFWDEIFKPVLHSLKDVRYVSLEQAAFSKYVENCFLATKVTFFNEMYQIFEKSGFSGFDAMVDAITLDPRIGKSHTQVPGPDGEFGYGGHCLPKDIAALVHIAASGDTESTLLDAVIKSNAAHRK